MNDDNKLKSFLRTNSAQAPCAPETEWQQIAKRTVGQEKRSILIKWLIPSISAALLLVVLYNNSVSTPQDLTVAENEAIEVMLDDVWSDVYSDDDWSSELVSLSYI